MEPLWKSKGEGTVVRLNTPDDVEALLQLLEQIADEESWQPGSQLRAYLDASHHFAVQVKGQLVGGLQVVLSDTPGCLPYQRVWPEVAIAEASRVAHITILALRSEYRGRPGLFWPLCVELWRFCVSEKVETVVLEATPLMLERYRKLGWPLEVIGELRLHWGEECFLCQMPMSSVAGNLLIRALRSPIYRTLIAQAARSGAPADCTAPPTLLK